MYLSAALYLLPLKILWKAVRLHYNVSIMWYCNLMGYSHKQIDGVINTIANILRKINYHNIVHVLSFCIGYCIYIIVVIIIDSSYYIAFEGTKF